ncbi:MAG TPA: hypothetical protein PKO18_04620 [Chitinophagales bacterium]|nr:hypothetical protein [Chitinophagales bacterium]HNL84502.1 hypothetical protein [Chitinophagales bacterium]
MSRNKKTIKGKVEVKKFGSGTKSEHNAIYIRDNLTNEEYVLRLKGTNPFENNELKSFIGKEVKAKGILDDYLFLADKIAEV